MLALGVWITGCDEDDTGEAEHISSILDGSEAPRFEIAHVARIEEALEKLRSESFHVILIALESADRCAVAAMNELSALADGAPIVVMMDGDASDTARLQGAGVEEQLPRTDTTARLLLGTLRHAVERHSILRDLSRARQHRPQGLPPASTHGYPRLSLSIRSCPR